MSGRIFPAHRRWVTRRGALKSTVDNAANSVELFRQNLIQNQQPTANTWCETIPILAQTLAHKYDLDFAEVFSHQYVIRKGKDRVIDGMNCFTVRNWSFCIGRELPCFTIGVPAIQSELVFIGIGVDAEGQLVTKERLAQVLPTLATALAVQNYLNASAGRFIYALLGKTKNQLFGDASASMASYFTPSAGLIGCSQLLALDGDVDPNSDYPGFDEAAIPGGSFNFTQTADTRCNQLVANHYLDMDSWQQTRFWPTESDDFTCPSTKQAIEERVDFVVRRQQQVIATLARAHSPCYLPLSGGSDSRTLLAFAKPVLKEIDPFVHIMGWTSRCDAFVARRLANLYDLELKELDAMKDDDVILSPEAHDKQLLSLGLSQGLIYPGPKRRYGLTDTTFALPKGGLVLRGQIINITKGYRLSRKYVAEFVETLGATHRPWVGMRVLGLKWTDKAGKRWMRSQYMDWIDSLPAGAKPRVVDLALVEQHRTHSMGRFLNLFSRSFYMAPACDRACIKAMISIPPHLRYHLYIHDMIFQQAAPELLNEPYHKLFTPYFEGFRHQDTLEEQLAKLPARV